MDIVQSLQPFEQVLLQFISIIYEPVSIKFLHTCLGRADFSFPNDHSPSGDELRAMIGRLHKLELLNELNQCSPELAEQLTRQAVQQGRFTYFAALIEKQAPVSYLYGKWSTRCWRALREFRIGIHSHDFDKIDEAAGFVEEQCREQLGSEPPSIRVVARNFDPQWFGGLPGSLQFFLLDRIIRYSMEHAVHFPQVFAYLEDEKGMNLSVDEQIPFQRMLAGYYLLQGNYEKLKRLLALHEDSFQGSGFAGSVAFLQGRNDEAWQLFEHDLQLLDKYAGPEGNFFFGITGLFCILALLVRNSPDDRE